MQRKRQNISERFFKKIIKTEECWNWSGCISKGGYGKITEGGRYGKILIASRASWIIHFGEIPKGKFVLHKCDNRRCVNPDHLFIGTQKDNIQDMYKKRRNVAYDRSGIKNPRCKLTEKQVIEIRKNFVAYTGKRNIGSGCLYWAKKFGVNCKTVWSIINGDNWIHIKTPQT
jgi:hypothetical protein